MSKRRKNGHRKIYEDYYGAKIPAGMDIHHIDEDPENDDIQNLLMLPKELHRKYHRLKMKYDRIQFDKFDGLLLSHNQIHFTVMEQFGKVCEECLYWMSYKARMDSHKSLVGDMHG